MAEKNRTACFEGSLQRGHFDLQDHAGYSYEKYFSTFLRTFEF